MLQGELLAMTIDEYLTDSYKQDGYSPEEIADTLRTAKIKIVVVHDDNKHVDTYEIKTKRTVVFKSS